MVPRENSPAHFRNEAQPFFICEAFLVKDPKETQSTHATQDVIKSYRNSEIFALLSHVLCYSAIARDSNTQQMYSNIINSVNVALWHSTKIFFIIADANDRKKQALSAFTRTNDKKQDFYTKALFYLGNVQSLILPNSFGIAAVCLIIWLFPVDLTNNEVPPVGWVVSSESCSFFSLGAELIRDVLPGMHASVFSIRFCEVIPVRFLSGIPLYSLYRSVMRFYCYFWWECVPLYIFPSGIRDSG